jgi:hypothetical protein
LLVFVNGHEVVSAVHDHAERRSIGFGCLALTSRGRGESAIVVYRTQDRDARTGEPLDPALFATWKQAPTRVGCLRSQSLIMH